MKKINAFTLAEILITLGIIGVVAAITIPGLINAYRAQQLRSQFLKAYSTVQQAFKLMESDDVDTNMRNYNTTNNPFYKTFAKYLSQSTICGSYTDGNNVSTTKNPSGCYKYKISNIDEGYKYLNSNNFIGDGLFNNGQLMLPDGTLIFFDDSPQREGWKGVIIYIDINGYKKKPNRLGYDFFAFEVIEGVVHAIGETETSYIYNDDCKFGPSGKLGFTCSKRAKNESDYFKTVVKKIK
uniref:Pilin n=1 Tax=uncultured Candidatus Melainabacteria bacterium TaxID=2682970 RepID=A0A650EIV2_9BACT|nr:hypothetical protein Melaina855_0060 [uncultured Candidatus Melainabacteria bacterium]